MANAGYQVSVATVGEIVGLIHAAGVSPSQASPETILRIDLYGTAVVLEEFGRVMAHDGSGVVISPQSGHRLPALTVEQAKRAGTPDEVGAVGALLMGPDGGFITGSDFLMDGGVTAAYWYGDVAEVRAQ